MAAVAAGETPAPAAASDAAAAVDVQYEQYKDESQLEEIVELVSKDLSEPYSIFTYRYFINNWPQLCLRATVDDNLVGVIVCRMEEHRGYMRGYIAMVAVDKAFRKQGIGSELAQRVIKHMQTCCDEVVLEAETTNASALRMYQRLGFLRTKRLPKYYMSGSDAFRLKLTF